MSTTPTWPAPDPHRRGFPAPAAAQTVTPPACRGNRWLGIAGALMLIEGLLLGFAGFVVLFVGGFVVVPWAIAVTVAGIVCLQHRRGAAVVGAGLQLVPVWLIFADVGGTAAMAVCVAMSSLIVACAIAGFATTPKR